MTPISSKRKYLYFLLLVIVLITMVKLRPYIMGKSLIIADRDYPEIKEDGVLRVVTEYNSTSYFVSGDTISGFEYELCKLLQKQSGIHIEIYPEMSLKTSFEKLDKGLYDVIARPIPITSALRSNYNFTKPLFTNKQILVQRKAEYNDNRDPIRNQLELAKKTLYFKTDASIRSRIENLSQEIADTINMVEDPAYGDEQLIVKVAKKEIDFAVCDYNTALKFRLLYPEIDINTDISFTQFQAWALRKNSVILLDSINHWLNQITKTKEFNTLIKKYFLHLCL